MPEEFKFGLRLTIDNKDLTVGVGLAEKDIKRLARVIKEAAGPTGRATRAIRHQTAALRKNRGSVSQAVDAFRKLTQANQRTGRSFAQAHGHHLKYIAALRASFTEGTHHVSITITDSTGTRATDSTTVEAYTDDEGSNE